MKYRPIFLTLFVVLFLCLVGVLVGAAPVRASTAIIVSTTIDELNDDGQCSLREAIRAANLDTASGATPGECPAGSGADTIIVPSGIYTLTRLGTGEDAALMGDLDITSTVTISGTSAASTIIDGGGIDRVLHVTGSTVTVSKVTVRGGTPPSAVSGINNGGGIRNEAVLIIDSTTISGNTTGSAGGGIYNSGTLTVTGSTIFTNTAAWAFSYTERCRVLSAYFDRGKTSLPM